MEKFSINVYKLPVREDKLEGIVTKQTMLTDEQKSHVKNFANAIDFLVPENAEVYAALDGEVTTVKDDAIEGGSDKKYLGMGNFVVIRHANKEFTSYGHFRYKGIVVKAGSKVKEGQLLGFVGMTGYTFRPHLHFEVFIWPSSTARPEERETIKARFKEFDDIYAIGR